MSFPSIPLQPGVHHTRALSRLLQPGYQTTVQAKSGRIPFDGHQSQLLLNFPTRSLSTVFVPLAVADLPLIVNAVQQEVEMEMRFVPVDDRHPLVLFTGDTLLTVAQPVPPLCQ